MPKSCTLNTDERISLALRELYEEHGYAKYRMSKFENYDIYAENRAFLPEGGIITFTDLDGNLLAMKPDVTLSIANSIGSGKDISEKIYYCENVYRVPAGGREYKEIMQIGVECIGAADLLSTCEVLSLAIKSMRTIGREYMLDISHTGLVTGLLEHAELSSSKREELSGYINKKSAHDIIRFCAENGISDGLCERMTELTQIYAPMGEALELIAGLDINDSTHAAVEELKDIYRVLRRLDMDGGVFLDFSFADNTGYYDGIKFKGYADGIYSAVLAGGSYGKLLKKLKKQAGAIGFAVYLNRLEGIDGESTEDAEILSYTDGDDAADVLLERERLIADGGCVRIKRNDAEGRA